MGRKNSSKKYYTASPPSTPSASQPQSLQQLQLDVESPPTYSQSHSVLKTASQNVSPNPFSAKTIPLPKTYSKVIAEPSPPIFTVPSTPVKQTYNDVFPALPPIRKQTLNPPPGFPKKINDYVLFPPKPSHFEEYQQQRQQWLYQEQEQQRLYQQQQQLQEQQRIRQQLLLKQQQQQIRHSQELQAQQMYYQQMHSTTPLSMQSMRSYENFWTSIPGYSQTMYSEQSRQSYHYFPK